MKIRVAEWVSFLISLTLIIAMAGYLIYDVARGQDPHVRLETEIVAEKVKTTGDRFIATILVHNRSRKSAMHVKVKALNQDFELDYLPAEATEKLFVIGTEEELRGLKAEPISFSEK